MLRNCVNSDDDDFHNSTEDMPQCPIEDEGKYSEIAETRGSVGICDAPIVFPSSLPRVLFQERGGHAIIKLFISFKINLSHLFVNFLLTLEKQLPYLK